MRLRANRQPAREQRGGQRDRRCDQDFDQREPARPSIASRHRSSRVRTVCSVAPLDTRRDPRLGLGERPYRDGERPGVSCRVAGKRHDRPAPHERRARAAVRSLAAPAPVGADEVHVSGRVRHRPPTRGTAAGPARTPLGSTATAGAVVRVTSTGRIDPPLERRQLFQLLLREPRPRWSACPGRPARVDHDQQTRHSVVTVTTTRRDQRFEQGDPRAPSLARRAESNRLRTRRIA